MHIFLTDLLALCFRSVRVVTVFVLPLTVILETVPWPRLQALEPNLIRCCCLFYRFIQFYGFRAEEDDSREVKHAKQRGSSVCKDDLL